MRSSPILIGYDGTPASEHAIREAADLLSGRPALVVVVWKAGLAFELIELPTSSVGLPPAPLDIRAALETDRALYEGAQRSAQQRRRARPLARSGGRRARRRRGPGDHRRGDAAEDRGRARRASDRRGRTPARRAAGEHDPGGRARGADSRHRGSGARRLITTGRPRARASPRFRPAPRWRRG